MFFLVLFLIASSYALEIQFKSANNYFNSTHVTLTDEISEGSVYDTVQGLVTFLEGNRFFIAKDIPTLELALSRNLFDRLVSDPLDLDALIVETHNGSESSAPSKGVVQGFLLISPEISNGRKATPRRKPEDVLMETEKRICYIGDYALSQGNYMISICSSGVECDYEALQILADRVFGHIFDENEGQSARIVKTAFEHTGGYRSSVEYYNGSVKVEDRDILSTNWCKQGWVMQKLF